MSQLVTCASIQLAYQQGQSFDARVDHALDLVAAQRGVDLVVLPELWPNGGFTYQDWEETAQPLDGPLTKAFSEMAATNQCVVHMGSFVERHDTPINGRSLTNTSVLFGPDGSRLAVYRKMHLFGFSEGEPQLMAAGDDVVVASTPIGTVGLATCYDLRFPELFRHLTDAGAELLIIPAAWPLSRIDHWQVLTRARAIENQVVVVAVNTVGLQNGKPMGGRSAAIDARGRVLGEASADEEQVLSVQFDLADVHAWRAQFPVRDDRRL